VDYGATPVPGFAEFSKQLFAEMLDVVRSNRSDESRPDGKPEEADDEESPFEDVSAERLVATLYESFNPVGFHTICPFIDPQAHIPHYRSEEERIFQHYLGCALVAAGEEAIARRHTDGLWFLFHMTPERPSPGRVGGGVDVQLTETIKAIRATTKISAHLEAKDAYISELEAEVERKNAALADMEKQLRQTEQELIKSREPKLPWKRLKR
jgi:hypothetical protein